MEGGDVVALRGQGVERGLLLLDFGLQDIGRIGLADVGELACGFGGIGGDGAELFAGVDLLLKGERGVEAAFDVGFDALLLRGECSFSGVLLRAIDIAAQAELAAERNGLLEEGALLAAAIGAATDLVALVADDGIGQRSGLSRLTGALRDGCLRGTEGGVVGAGGCQQSVESERCAVGSFGQ